MEDRKIIELYFNRSEKAITETAKKYGRYCYIIAFNILGIKEDSDECVNDAYFRVWNSIPPKRPVRLQTYIGKIVRNLSINRYQKIKAQKRGSGQTALVIDELSECIPDKCDLSADDVIIKNALNKFLKSLPQGKRNVFIQRYWYMYSVKEIAKNAGLTESNVSVTLMRLREELKNRLESEGVIV